MLAAPASTLGTGFAALLAGLPARGGLWPAVHNMARRLDGRTLVTLLDELRGAYELTRQSGPAELERHLLRARSAALALIRQQLLLQSELAMLRDAISRHDACARAAQTAAEEALFTTRRGDQGSRKPS
jgi:hypothetical protein